MTEDCRITPPPPHLLKKFSAQAQDEAKKRNGAGYLKTFATLCIEWAMNRQSTPNDRQIRSSGIEPSPELVQQWMYVNDVQIAPLQMVQMLATQAARWGADQQLKLDAEQINEAWQKGADAELEACCEWLVANDWKAVHKHLRAALAEPEPEGPTPQPVPVSERLPGPDDCDGEGNVWAWRRFDSEGDMDNGDFWCVAFCEWLEDEDCGFTHWLPAHALPVPSYPTSLSS